MYKCSSGTIHDALHSTVVHYADTDRSISEPAENELTECIEKRAHRLKTDRAITGEEIKKQHIEISRKKADQRLQKLRKTKKTSDPQVILTIKLPKPVQQ